MDPTPILGSMAFIVMLAMLIVGPKRLNDFIAELYDNFSDRLNRMWGYHPEEPELEPIDYKALEKANYQSMVDSWDEAFLELQAKHEKPKPIHPPDFDGVVISNLCARDKHKKCPGLGIAGVREGCGCECHYG